MLIAKALAGVEFEEVKTVQYQRHQCYHGSQHYYSFNQDLLHLRLHG